MLPEGPAGAVLHNLVEDLFTLLQLQALPPGAPFGLKHLVPMEEDTIIGPREEKCTKQKMYTFALKKRKSSTIFLEQIDLGLW